MKVYTDLEQSRILARILPIESADGYWIKNWPCQPYMVCTAGTVNSGKHIPCWSLSALLEVLPLRLYDESYEDDHELVIDMIDKMPRYIRLGDIYHSQFPYDFEKDTLLDNVVESIIWLNDNNYLKIRN